jgi:transcriptional regulator with GAF, ATPase, and Fis domain
VDLLQTKQAWHIIVMHTTTQSIVLDTFNLESAERRLCVEALTAAGNIVGAAKLLGITRHSMKRRIVKLGIGWTRQPGRILGAQPEMTAVAAA